MTFFAPPSTTFFISSVPCSAVVAARLPCILTNVIPAFSWEDTNNVCRVPWSIVSLLYCKKTPLSRNRKALNDPFRGRRAHDGWKRLCHRSSDNINDAEG